MQSDILKRILDLTGAVIGLTVFSAPMAAVAVAIRFTIGSPILFRQERAGLQGKPFVMLKFRTMHDRRDAGGKLLSDEERLSRAGRLLRATSLDELPSLFNVLRGEMSLVGPRPLLMEYLPRYSPEQARRHEVKPGITGVAQVAGRNAVSWEEKFKLDVWYIDHRNFLLDISVLWTTLVTVLKQRGVSAPGHATMPIFMGSEGETDEQRTS